MALPSSGNISLGQIKALFGGPGNLKAYYRNGGYVPSVDTNVPTSGSIDIQAFYSATLVTPGSNNYTTPGTYTFTVPYYNNLTVVVSGGGGDCGSFPVYINAGGNSYFNAATQVFANGGGGAYLSVNGSNGTASGGTTNITGGGAAGGIHSGYYGGNGGYSSITWSVGSGGAPTHGQNIAVVVGLGGNSAGSGTNGANGYVDVSWN